MANFIFKEDVLARRSRRTETGLTLHKSFTVWYDGELSNWANISQYDVLIHPSCPQVGDMWDADIMPYATAIDVDVQHYEDQPFMFQVVVEYRTEGNRGEALALDPVERLPELVGFRWVEYQRAVYKHKLPDSQEELPIQSSSAEPFQEPIMLEETEPIIEVVRNENLPFSLAYSVFWKGAINSEVFNLMGYEFPKRYVRISEITPVIRQDAGKRYVAVNYGFHVSDRLIEERYDFGTRYYNPDVRPPLSPWKPITYGLHEPTPRPVALDGNGNLAADPLKPALLKFYVRKELDFNTLGFPP